VSTLDRTRVIEKRPVAPTASRVQPSPGPSPSLAQQDSGAIDHWSVVLFYSMGIGTLAVVALLFAVLIVVWMYSQFIRTFTHWDLADVRLTSVKSFAYFLVLTTFVGGTCAGWWFFSGAAWKTRKGARASSGHARRHNR
jgi:hypothetical protein